MHAIITFTSETAMTYFDVTRPDHGPYQIKNGADLKVGNMVIAHYIYCGKPAVYVLTVTNVNVEKMSVKFAEWGDVDYPWADYGLVPYSQGTTFAKVDISSLYQQQYWLERILDN